jgi:TPR repeat protein
MNSLQKKAKGNKDQCKDKSKAMEWYKKSAEAVNCYGMFNYGFSLANGF